MGMGMGMGPMLNTVSSTLFHWIQLKAKLKIEIQLRCYKYGRDGVQGCQAGQRVYRILWKHSGIERTRGNDDRWAASGCWKWMKEIPSICVLAGSFERCLWYVTCPFFELTLLSVFFFSFSLTFNGASTPTCWYWWQINWCCNQSKINQPYGAPR